MINNYELIDKIKSYNKFLNYNTLNKAFKFAIDAHKNQIGKEFTCYKVAKKFLGCHLLVTMVARLH